MRRRGARPDRSPLGPGGQAVEDRADDGALPGVDDEPEVWSETWEQSEKERVARWLECKTRRPAVTSDAGSAPPAADLWAPGAQEPELTKPDREEYRRSLVAGLESARHELEAHRSKERQARAVLEREIRSLERRRRRVAADLEMREAEDDDTRREQLAVRDGLADEVERLVGRQRELAGAVADARVEFEAVQQEHASSLERLQVEIGALSQERAQVAGAAEAARLEAKAARRAALDERNRIEQEIRALSGELARATAALEAARREADAACQSENERSRMEQEIRALWAQERGLRGEAEAREATGATPEDQGGRASPKLDPSGKLAASVAELGCHLAAILERERAQAERRAAERRQSEALLRARLAAAEGRGPDPPLAEGGSAARRRRRRGGDAR